MSKNLEKKSIINVKDDFLIIYLVTIGFKPEETHKYFNYDKKEITFSSNFEDKTINEVRLLDLTKAWLQVKKGEEYTGKTIPQSLINEMQACYKMYQANQAFEERFEDCPVWIAKKHNGKTYIINNFAPKDEWEEYCKKLNIKGVKRYEKK